MKKYIFPIILCAASCLSFGQVVSVFDSGTTSAEVVLPSGYDMITAISASSDTNTAVAKVLAPLKGYAPTSAAASGTNLVALTNTGTAIASSDTVLVVFANGATQVTTVSSSTTSSVTLAANLSAALSTDGRVYDLAEVWRATVSTNAFLHTGEPLAGRSSDGPLVVTLNGQTACWLAVTAKP